MTRHRRRDLPAVLLIRSVSVALLGGAISVGCGAERTLAPTPPPSQVTIQSCDDIMLVGAKMSCVAAATSASGATSVASAAWTTDAPAVATVDASGTVTGVGPGAARIFATFQGVAGSMLVRVVPDFRGTWTGASRMNRCEAPPGWMCTAAYPLGATFPVTLELSQARDRVTGRIEVMPDFGDVDGTITLDGRLVFTTRLWRNCQTCGVPSPIPSWFLADWQSSLAVSASMSASYSQEGGSMRWYWDVSAVRR